MRRKGDKRTRTEAQMIADRDVIYQKTRRPLCCFIIDQDAPGDGCMNFAVYQIWNGDSPTPDDYTESCAAHLEQMLDDSMRFEILRIVHEVSQ